MTEATEPLSWRSPRMGSTRLFAALAPGGSAWRGWRRCCSSASPQCSPWRRPRPPVPTRRAEAFSAARAMTHISAIADEPRPMGSAQHDEARAYLLDQLGSLGWRTEVQESIGMFDFGRRRHPVDRRGRAT